MFLTLQNLLAHEHLTVVDIPEPRHGMESARAPVLILHHA